MEGQGYLHSHINNHHSLLQWIHVVIRMPRPKVANPTACKGSLRKHWEELVLMVTGGIRTDVLHVNLQAETGSFVVALF